MWELIRKGIMGKVRAGGAVKQNLFNFAFAAKRALGPHSFISKILDAVVFKAVKEATGGHLMYAVNGGAAIAKETQEFLQTCLVPTLIQGYGALCLFSSQVERVGLISRHNRNDRVVRSLLHPSPKSTPVWRRWCSRPICRGKTCRL